jgi:hypothetical protein
MTRRRQGDSRPARAAPFPIRSEPYNTDRPRSLGSDRDLAGKCWQWPARWAECFRVYRRGFWRVVWATFFGPFLGIASAQPDARAEDRAQAEAAFGELPTNEDEVGAAFDEVAQESPDVTGQDLEVDDFSVPDDASFETLWDGSAHPELYFTSPGCTFDVSGGRRSDQLGTSWFIGAFVSFPLGGPCSPTASLLGLSTVPLAGSLSPSPSSERVSSERLYPKQVSPARAGNPHSVRGASETTSESPPAAASGPLARNREPSRHALDSPGFLAEFGRRLRASGGADALIDRIDRLARKERSSGLLPEVRLRGAYGIDQSLALETVGSIGGEATTRDGSDSVFEARLTFHLERLLAPPNSTGLERLRHAVLREEEEQLQSGLELLSNLIEEEALSALPELSELDQLKHSVKARALRMQIHVLTGGWFPLTPNPLAATVAQSPNSPGPITLPAPSPPPDE